MTDSLPPPVLGGQIRRLIPYLQRQRRGIVSVTSLAMAGATLAAFEPLALKCLFDAFLEGRGGGGPAMPFLVLIGILVCREALGSLQERVFWRTRLALNFDLLRATV